jgi:lysozyme family protein
MSDFEQALALTLQFEGGYSNHPKDPGGATMKGVTQRVFDKYCTDNRIPHRDVRTITDDEVEDIYLNRYWIPAKCMLFSWPLNAAIFDFAVNSGVSRAIIELQRCVGVKTDGIFGPVTKKAATQMDQTKLVGQYLDARVAFLEVIMKQNPALEAFRKGWMRRVATLRKGLLGK